jgi:hypothetical protein
VPELLLQLATRASVAKKIGPTDKNDLRFINNFSTNLNKNFKYAEIAIT